MVEVDTPNHHHYFNFVNTFKIRLDLTKEYLLYFIHSNQ